MRIIPKNQLVNIKGKLPIIFSFLHKFLNNKRKAPDTFLSMLISNPIT